jgi:hypothetical protein
VSKGGSIYCLARCCTGLAHEVHTLPLEGGRTRSWRILLPAAADQPRLSGMMTSCEIASPGEREVEAQLQRIGQADLVVGAGYPGNHGVAARMAADLVTYMVDAIDGHLLGGPTADRVSGR